MATAVSNKTKVLQEWWTELSLKKYDRDPEEMSFFYHCTKIKYKRRILETNVLKGSYTGLPSSAPLASNEDITGVWLAVTSIELPTKSPYGSQRILIKADSLIALLSTPPNEEIEPMEVSVVYNSDDHYDAESSDEDKGHKGRKSRKSKKRGEKTEKAKKNRKDCYLKHKNNPHILQLPQKPPKAVVEVRPLLFFESAHYYSHRTQYVRLVLVRAWDNSVRWCRENLIEINLYDNRFFRFDSENKKILCNTKFRRRREVFVEILVVGDIDLKELKDAPEWDSVGNLQKAGVGPRLGVL